MLRMVCMSNVYRNDTSRARNGVLKGLWRRRETGYGAIMCFMGLAVTAMTAITPCRADPNLHITHACDLFINRNISCHQLAPG